MTIAGDFLRAAVGLRCLAAAREINAKWKILVTRTEGSAESGACRYGMHPTTDPGSRLTCSQRHPPLLISPCFATRIFSTVPQSGADDLHDDQPLFHR